MTNPERLLTSILTTFISLIIKIFSKADIFTFRDVILSFVLVLCINLVLFTHLPVTADRSVSVFLLGYMNRNPGIYLTEEEITRVFTEKYIYENKNIQKRFGEQIASGNIVGDGGRYIITRQGKLTVSFYNFIADLFMIDKKNISP